MKKLEDPFHLYNRTLDNAVCGATTKDADLLFGVYGVECVACLQTERENLIARLAMIEEQFQELKK